MAQKLRENIAPPEDLGLFPSTYMAAYNYGLIPVLVDPIPLLVFMESCTHVGHIKRLKQANIYTLIKNKKILKQFFKLTVIHKALDLSHSTKRKKKLSQTKPGQQLSVLTQVFILALGRHRQVISEFQAFLIYRTNLRTDKAT